MANPTSRALFKENCLRRLGKPVIDVNVDDDQVDDRITEALRYYWDYHFDGTEKLYYKHQIIAEDITNKYITLPETIIGAVNIFDVGQSMSSNDIFNIRYQIALNDLYTLTSVSMLPYFMAIQHVQFLEQMLVGKQPIRYNRHSNKLYIDMSWDKVSVGEYLVIEAYEVLDPDTYTDVWSDRWLLRYATCLIKEQWGNNLKVMNGIKLLGGITLNGQAIYNEAILEKEKLEKEMITSYSLPNLDMIG